MNWALVEAVKSMPYRWELLRRCQLDLLQGSIICTQPSLISRIIIIELGGQSSEHMPTLWSRLPSMRI